MHRRFRKKSDVKSTEFPLTRQSQTQTPEQYGFLPELPPESDFRTSLILPDLSRRFSLLRSPTGDPVTVDDLKSRFAEQRARGAAHQISEEEEEMLFDTLSIGRSRSRASGGSQEFVLEGDDTITSKLSARSGNTSSSSLTPSSVNSSPSKPAKRYSNNLFGSGRLRDYSYLKNVASVKSNGSTRTNSFTPTEASMATRANTSSVAESLRPMTPDGTSTSLSVQSSPNDKSSLSSAIHAPSTSYTDQSMSAAEYRISKTLGPSVLKRASLALEEAIKELEDEADDEIVMPRSPPVLRSGLEQQSNIAVRDSAASHSSSIIEAGMAISFDKHSVLDERRASPIPSRTLPGYIPGMPRPMTPRDFDLEEQRSHSTTPRAATPTAVAVLESGSPLCNSTSGVHKRESFGTNSRQSARPTTPSSPLFLQRSPNGRHTPDDSLRGDPIEFDSPASSSIIGRRRPASPLSGPPYQPMSVPSRPTTPSNVVWAPRTSETSQWAPGHSRDNSWVSDGGISSSDIHGSIDRHILGPPTRPPVLPESTPDRTFVTASQITSLNHDAGSLAAFRMPRSSTPTQSASRSPVSSTFPEMSPKNNKRSSKQNPPSSPFNFGPYPSSLSFSPLVNSSRSSLESVGSSFHSWDGEKDRTLSLFSDADPLQPAWHDFPDKSSNTTPDGSPRDEWDAEDVVKTIAGLKKADFTAIQEKLVGVAILKAMNPEYRERAPSSMRRRRPSTSQSNYSARVASPAPPASPTLMSSPTPFDLLKSIVDNSPHRDPPAALYTTSSTTNAPSLSDTEVSPTTRRNRDLAQVLFGQEEREEASKKLENPSIDSLLTPTNDSPSIDKPGLTDTPSSPVSSQTPYQLTRNPSTPRIPQTPQEEADLTREVQQKTNAAMFALKGVSNSNAGGLSHSPSITHKRINTTQISTPRLVSATTSVDTIPLRSPSLSANNSVGPSKIGSRIKKLTGSLRAKNVTSSGEETTTYASDHKAPPGGQAVSYDLTKTRSGDPSTPMSATQAGSFKVSVPNPPASAGPGLRGFMARFRAKQRFGTSSETEHRLSPQPRLMPLSPPQPQQPQTQARPSPPQFQPQERSPLPLQPSQVQSPEQPSQEHQRQDGWSQVYSTRSDLDSNPSTPRPGRVSPETSLSPEQEEVSASEANETALRQLFDAAARVGLDSSAISALNDLVKRSGSVSSRPIDLAALTRNASTSTTHPSMQPSTQLKPPESDRVQRTGSDETATPDTPSSKRASPSNLEVPQELYRLTPEPTRRPRQGLSENASNAVIRRTIIYPNDLKMAGPEVNTVTRKNSRRRRASANSISTRSVHDRAPTPPPPKSPTSKRFSSEGSPPVPHLPHTHARQAPDAASSSAAPGAIEKSNSMYDSLYDMYGDVHSRAPSSAAIDPNDPKSDFAPSTESRTGIEVVELANGETIWSIVKGLRDDEEEEYGYGNRASFASEYSNGDGMQVAFKEHARSGSKGSVSSAVSRKAQGKNRPETKVYFSSSAHIGRLIEGLSQGKEAASFNFIPSHRGVGHSASSSLSTTDWTVEERLEQMLGSINNV